MKPKIYPPLKEFLLRHGVLEQFEENCIRENVNYEVRSVGQAFIFKYTTQGLEFWKKIWDMQDSELSYRFARDYGKLGSENISYAEPKRKLEQLNPTEQEEDQCDYYHARHARQMSEVDECIKLIKSAAKRLISYIKRMF